MITSRTGAAVLGRLGAPGPADVEAILALASAADDCDGAYPLAEQVVLGLRSGAAGAAAHLTARGPDGALVGYAHVDPGDPADPADPTDLGDADDPAVGATAELVVHPLHRRRGLGRALLTAALAVARERDPHGRLRCWAHGDHPSAGALAIGLGFERVRVLWQLRRPLTGPLPDVAPPAGVTLRALRPGIDDGAWVALNARAFAEHPEQGRWTVADLRLRMAEPWFDPAGFLLAVDDASGAPVGFHWTKVHRGAGTDPVGEVYVLGVDPAAQRRSLGAALAVAGLRHLRGQGLRRAMLYVDESNTAAVALYRTLGFARWSADVTYRHGD